MNTDNTEQSSGQSIMEFLSNAMDKSTIDEQIEEKKNELQELERKRNARKRMVNRRRRYSRYSASGPAAASGNATNASTSNTNATNTNATASGNSTAANKTKHKKSNPDVLLEDDHDLELFKESWLTIAYKKLGSSNLFPTLNLPNFAESWIETIPGKFTRKNNAFDAAKKTPNDPPTEFDFYVRLSGKNLFYSANKKDLLVLGSVPLDGLANSEKFKDPQENAICFKVFDKRRFQWKLCAANSKLRNEWVCLIKKILKEKDRNECIVDEKDDQPITYYEKKVNQAIILIPLAAPHCNENWNYNSHGADWECECKEGNNYTNKYNNDNIYKYLY